MNIFIKVRDAYMKSNKTCNTWAENEFSNINLRDARLKNRLIKLTNSLSDIPQSSINQACGSWVSN